MPLDWIESNPNALDSNESNRNELEWTGLSAVYWMLFCHGVVEFLIVGFLQSRFQLSISLLHDSNRQAIDFILLSA